MPIYRRKSRTGEVHRIVVWVNGTSHEKRFHGTAKEANSEEARWRLELESSVEAPRPKHSAVDLLTFSRGDYAVHAKAHLRKRTWDVRRYQLATLCDRHEYADEAGRAVVVDLGRTKTGSITTEHIDRYKAARISEGAKPRTINTELAKLQAVRSYGRDVGVAFGDFKVRPLPEIGRGRVTFWTEDQLSRLFVAFENESPDLLPIVVFIANTGCRKGEALACESAWIDLDRGMVTIQPNEYWQPKDNEPREIPISSSLRPWLERAMVKRGKYVFTTSKRGPGQEERTRWAEWPKAQFDRAREASGLRGGPHTLRHSFAAHFLAARPDMFLLAQLLGHSHARTTKLYAHLLPSHLERARDAVSVGPKVGPAKLEAAKRWRAKRSNHGEKHGAGHNQRKAK